MLHNSCIPSIPVKANSCQYKLKYYTIHKCNILAVPSWVCKTTLIGTKNGQVLGAVATIKMHTSATRFSSYVSPMISSHKLAPEKRWHSILENNNHLLYLFVIFTSSVLLSKILLLYPPISSKDMKRFSWYNGYWSS